MLLTGTPNSRKRRKESAPGLLTFAPRLLALRWSVCGASSDGRHGMHAPARMLWSECHSAGAAATYGCEKSRRESLPTTIHATDRWRRISCAYCPQRARLSAPTLLRKTYDDPCPVPRCPRRVSAVAPPPSPSSPPLPLVQLVAPSLRHGSPHPPPQPLGACPCSLRHHERHASTKRRRRGAPRARGCVPVRAASPQRGCERRAIRSWEACE